MPNEKSLSPSEAMLLTAKNYRNVGLSVMPIAHDSKKPVVKWKRYENELIAESELDRLYRTPFYGKLPDRVAVIGGPVSGDQEAGRERPDRNCHARRVVWPGRKKGGQ